MKRIDQLQALGVPRRLADSIAAQAKPERKMRLAVSQKDGVGTVEIYEQIGFDWWTGEGMTAARFSQEIASLGSIDRLVLKINSPGGDVWDGLTIHNTIAMLDYPVETQIEGIAASAASVIAIAADKVLMHKASQMMIHNAWTVAAGNARDLREVADLLDKVDGQLAELYAGKGGKTKQDYLDAMAQDSYLTPEEAIVLGLADGMVELPNREAKASASRHLSASAKLFTLRQQAAL